MNVKYRLLIILVSFISCQNERETCMKLKKHWEDEKFDSVIFFKKEKRVATSTLYLKKNNNDSAYEYQTDSAWPLSLTYFLEKDDILEKKKGDSILYIIKKDTVLKFQYACDQSYINGKPVLEILKKKGIR